MYPIDVFQTFRFQIYMQVWNDETIEQQKQFIQWTTRLPEEIKMPHLICRRSLIGDKKLISVESEHSMRHGHSLMVSS